MKEYLLLPLLVSVVLGATTEGEQFVTRAVCALENGTPQGYVEFHQEPGQRVAVQGNITHLTPGLHGFHVHEYGDLTDGCTSAGSHYNPFGKDHGAPFDENRHVGDLGNIEADNSGSAVFGLTDHELQLNGEFSIIGRSIVVHQDKDDLGRGNFSDSLTTGHSGSRIACCVIGIAE
ncbi:superoxide dismutase [Cu-Zn] [Rhipicephalus sanguineus]|uniref:superoxide dismutase [Cu-Zn] n=1 Tax=Rhipicephalus sanguineus TaxID=34632 RepID=UPI0018935C2A|nr:superoxide dismutase [Cu-Zn] [Rhipicephalus sanguineus]